MFSRKDYILLAGVCLVLGFIIVRQFYLQRQVKTVSEPETGNSIAVEVAELTKTNDKLRKEIDKLNSNLAKLEESASSSQKASDALQENLKIYKIDLGVTNVTGSGVEIYFSDKVDSTQVVDLVNALKNIGAEAISINDRRLGPKTSIESGLFYPPTTISAIGNADLLKESLTRPGGIMDQIGSGKVEKKDNLYLKPI